MHEPQAHLLSTKPPVGEGLALWRVSMSKCNCYVRYLDEETRFCLHYGAHERDCPVYRPSLDPVDRANDEEYRAGMLAHIGRVAHSYNRVLMGPDN